VSLRARAYLLLIAVAMMATAIVVLILNRNLADELLGAIALLGGIAVALNAILDITGNPKDDE
jgi:hypothetical protein